MTDVAVPGDGRPGWEGLRLVDLPMAEDRTPAYAMLRAAGPVVRGRRPSSYMITSAEAVEFVLKHPELFSSQRAFDLAGSPLAMVPIIATQDVQLAGQTIPAGSYVMVTIAAASRDPAEHPDPDTIDFQRQERSLAFGGGPHRCLGSHLARMELRVALEEWHRRIPEYELAPGTVPQVTWPSGVVGIDHLPLVFPLPS